MSNLEDFKLSQIFNDRDGKTSSKRVIGSIAFFLMCIAFIANLFFSIPMEEFVFMGMLYVVSGSLGFSVLEHFSPNSKSAKEIKDKVENPELLEG